MGRMLEYLWGLILSKSSVHRPLDPLQHLV